jgi:hypothetical protein
MYSLGSISAIASEKKIFLLTLDPLGKMFQNASSLKPNCPGMIIGRSSVFYPDRKSKMAAGSNVKLSPAVAAILNFISEQKT